MRHEPSSVAFWYEHRTRQSVTDFLGAGSDVFQCPFGEFVRRFIPTEQKFQDRIIKAVRDWAKSGLIDKKTMVWKNGTGVYARSGLPDIFCVIEGRLVAFEVKRPFIGGEPTDIQKKSIRDINDAGGFAAWGSYSDELERLIKAAGLWKGEI